MCCFSGPVQWVSSTNIFAREAPDGRQHLVYSMKLSASEDLAMILPLPVPEGSAENAVSFVDLSGYPSFFEDLAKGFVMPTKSLDLEPESFSPREELAVVEVGSFEASFVPSIADFERLDPRFRLPTEVWEALPGYARFGFAVFKLKSGEREIHPMAFTFPRADTKKLFFPTVHIHDGAVRPLADFDHALYCQRSHDRPLDWPWRSSARLARGFVDPARSAGLVDGDADCFLRNMEGPGPNHDVYVDA